MDLRLKFMGVDKSDVIATSGACKYKGAGIAAKYVSAAGGTLNYYTFKDASGVTNQTAGVTMGAHGWGTIIIDVDGSNLGNIYPTVDSHYHYDSANDKLYKCDNPSHYGSFPK